MHDNDTIDDMVIRFTKKTNGLTSLGDAIDNDQKVRKVIRALSPLWEVCRSPRGGEYVTS